MDFSVLAFERNFTKPGDRAPLSPPLEILKAMAEQRTVVIGISGCSSSGKTTLARLLRDIFPETFILHEDDFYKPESEYASPPCPVHLLPADSLPPPTADFP